MLNTSIQGGLMFIQDVFFFHEHPYVIVPGPLLNMSGAKELIRSYLAVKSTSGLLASLYHHISAL